MRIGSILFAAALLALLSAEPSRAGVFNPIPADASGDPQDQFVDDDALFAYATSDIKGGEICIVNNVETMEGQSCERPVWGTANTVVGIGTTYTLIEAPALIPGTWKLLSVDSTGEPTGLSPPFHVEPCIDCSRELADAVVNEWKLRAFESKTGSDVMCTAWAIQAAAEIPGKITAAHGKVKKLTDRADQWESDGLGFFAIVPTLGGFISFPSASGAIQAGERKAKEILKNLICTVGEMYNDIFEDPPDPTYGSVEPPVFSEIDPLASTESDALALAIDNQAAHGYASLTAYERYLGAKEDGNEAGVHRQTRALADQTGELVDELRSTASALRDYAALLDTQPEFDDPMLPDEETRTMLADLYERVRTSGFTSEEEQELIDQGFTAAQIEDVRSHFALDPGTVPVGVTLAAEARDTATHYEDQIEAFDAMRREAAAVAARTNHAPVASFTRTPDSGAPPLLVEFDDTSTDEDGEPLTVTWDFGDGDAGEGAEIAHTYDTEGTFTVIQSVSDGAATSTSQQTVIVDDGNADPAAAFTHTQNRLHVEVDGSGSADPNGHALTWSWDWGDGSDDTAGPTSEHDYAAAGTYTVSLTVTDELGAEDTEEKEITVAASNLPPVADAGADLTVNEGESVFLDGQASRDPDGTIANYEWDFGDGTPPDTGPNGYVIHIYGEAGTYTATLTVTDGDGETATDEATVTVVNLPPTVDVGQFPRVTPGVSRPYSAAIGGGATEQIDVEVDFGDGSAAEQQTITGTQQVTFDHVYAEPGAYAITFTATDEEELSTSVARTVPVGPPVADAGPDLTIPEGDTVAFGGATSEPDTYTTVEWDFGDGQETSGREPTHRFADEGTFTVTVTVDDEGDPVTDTATITVENVAPEARLGAPASAAPGKAVSMRGRSADPGDDLPTFSWDFGDGSTGSGPDVTHTYAAAGQYDITLTVDDGDGGTDVATRTIVVQPPPGTRDSRGTDFWLAFSTNSSGLPELTLFIAGEEATTGTVEIPGIDFVETFTVAPGAVTPVQLPPGAQLETTVVEERAIHVTSVKEVSVYGLNRILYTTDAFLGLPVDALGARYRVMTYPHGHMESDAAVVATADDTTVTVTPSTVLAGGEPAETPFEVSLDEGEAFQVRAGGDDLTGTLVEADKPVSVFGAHRCANIPVGVSACDHLIEQLPPTDAWGAKFVTQPLATRTGGDTFRILSDSDGTEVSVDGTAVATLDAGEVHEQLIDGAALIEATEPVLVAQFSNGSGFDSTLSDPFMALVPPFEQFQASYTVTTPAAGFSSHFLNLVVPASAAGSIELDGVALPAGSFAPIGDSGFVGRHVEVAAGDHRVTGSKPFGITIYGFAVTESYGYPGGFGTGSIATVDGLELSPAAELLDVGSEGCVDAKATAGGVAVPDVRIDFAVAGKHPGEAFKTTGSDGVARYCYSGTEVGEDTITASLGALSATAAKTWRAANRPPVAAADSATTDAGKAVEIDLLANDSDPDGDPLAVLSTGAVTGGAVTVSGARATFTPAASFSGEAAFAYTIADGRGGTATATVRVAVAAPPVVVLPPAETGQTANDIVLGCTDRKIVLEDVVPKGRRVQLLGIADRSFAGEQVRIVFTATGKVVARATIAADGSFSTTAPLPARRLRNSNKARYQARVGGERSLALKLARRMRITAISASYGGSVVIRGRVAPPLAKKKKDRRILVQQVVGCEQARTVARFQPRKNGTFVVNVQAPKGARAAVYRLRTKVMRTKRSKRTVNTFTLPRSVDFS